MSIKTIKDVVSNDYCIGCGACALVNPEIKMSENKQGGYSPKYADNIDTSLANKVCPFSDFSLNESALARDLFDDCKNFDDLLGYYNGVYAGFVLEKEFRNSGSSGGLVSWLAAELLRLELIDCVVHVKETFEANNLFEYSVSSSEAEILSGAKTKYYPVHFDTAIKSILEKDQRVLVVGVPCFVKAIQSLCKHNKELRNNIRFTISLVCGHLKTKRFSDFLSLNAKVRAKDVVSLDYRVAMQGENAHKYGIRVTKNIQNGANEHINAGPVQSFVGEDWGVGLFKLKACDFCDDVAGEVADITIGDAWIPPYESDSRGTNIVVCRNKVIEDILLQGADEKRLKLNPITGQDFVYSQAGSFRHRREGLLVRMHWYTKLNKPFPRKRVSGFIRSIETRERRLFKKRHSLSIRSHAFSCLLQTGRSIKPFNFVMFLSLLHYEALKVGWLRAALPRKIKKILKPFLIKNFQNKVADRARTQYVQNHKLDD